MPPKSKLTESQWKDIIKRKLAGEQTRPLAREYGISDTAINKRVGLQCLQIKETANHIVAAERGLLEMPVSLQVQTMDYAAELRAMSSHMIEAARDSAATSKNMARVARVKSNMVVDNPVNDDDVELQGKLVKEIKEYQGAANLAYQIPMGLLQVNKENVPRLINVPEEDIPENTKKIIEMTDDELLSIATRRSS